MIYKEQICSPEFYRLNFSIREIVKISENPAQRHRYTGKHKCTLKTAMQS